ncbi:MAG: KDO2-lipid IV(A) lauroyltransferase [Phenylobacterium sp.]
MKKTKQPAFTLSLLGPKYWPIWCLLALMRLINLLPFRLQLLIGKLLGKLLYVTMKSRRKIAQRNIELCFPDKPAAEVEQIVKRNIENTGIALLESSIAWWWSNRRLRSLARFKGYEHIEKAQAQGKGVLLLCAHALHLEVDGRIFGMTHEAVGFYRPHNNALMEYFQYRGRCKSNKYMVGKRDVRGLIDALKEGEVCFYLPDQDYGRNRCEFVPFFAVKDTATTTGTLLFAEQSECVVIPLVTARLPGGQGYEIEALPAFENFPSGDAAADVTRVNQWVEKTVAPNIDQYMWVHRRFKTQPDPDAPSRYQ